MAQSPKAGAFLGKLARFVSNPNTDWASLDSAPPSQFLDAPEMPEGTKFTQAEIMAMRHQRRKKNRSIRIKEFGMLRHVQAGKVMADMIPEPDGLVSDVAETQPTMDKPTDFVKSKATRLSAEKESRFTVNKINDIEEQMVKLWWGNEETSPSTSPEATKSTPKLQKKAELGTTSESIESDSSDFDIIPADSDFFDNTAKSEAEKTVVVKGAGGDVDTSKIDESADFLHTLPVEEPQDVEEEVGEEIHVEMADYLAASTEVNINDLPESLQDPAILFAQDKDSEAEELLIEQSEKLKEAVEKDPELSEQEPHALLTLLDYYRATKQEERFENASLYMVQLLGRSAPQYLSADLAQASRILSTVGSEFVSDGTQTNWSCSAELDLTDVMLLRSQLIENPNQVLLDWRKLEEILDEAVEPLVDQLKDLAQRKIELLMWGADQLLACCKQQLEASPQPDKNTYTLLWHLRLELVRMMYDQETFEEESIEYCVALEESPPAWVEPKCFYINADEATDIIDDPQANAGDADDSQILESNTKHPLQWQGSMRGSIKKLLTALDTACGAQECVIDCLQLERIDSIATTELLAWLMAQKATQKRILFINVNRLVAVFWRIMGIHAQANIELRRD